MENRGENTGGGIAAAINAAVLRPISAAIVGDPVRPDWLVRSPNWLGDAVMSLPAMLVLRRHLPPEGKLAVVCPESLSELFTALRPALVDEVIAVPPHQWWGREVRGAVRGFRAEAGILFNKSFRDTLQLRMCGVRYLCGASARCRGWLLWRRVVFPRRRGGEPNHQHHAAQYLSLAVAVGAPAWDGSLPEFRISPEARLKLARKAPVLDEEGGGLLVIAPGAAYGEAKRWPAAGFAAIATEWLAAGGRVAIVGAKGEMAVAAEIQANLANPRSVDLAGKTNLPELMALLAASSACVANDSGVMHLAAAMGVPGVAVFGSTDPGATAPISDRWKVAYHKTECSPCFRRTCPAEHYQCLTAVKPEDVSKLLSGLARPTLPQKHRDF